MAGWGLAPWDWCLCAGYSSGVDGSQRWVIKVSTRIWTSASPSEGRGTAAQMRLLKLVKPHLSPGRENNKQGQFLLNKENKPCLPALCRVDFGPRLKVLTRTHPAAAVSTNPQTIATPLPHAQLVHSFYASNFHPLCSSMPWEPRQLPLSLSDPFMTTFSKISFQNSAAHSPLPAPSPDLEEPHLPPHSPVLNDL